MDEVGICNLALSWLGEDPIISLGDEGVTAQRCRNNYPSARDTALEDGDWTFATRYYRLTPLAGTVANDPRPPLRGQLFQKPPEMLRVIDCDDGSDEWRVTWERIEDRIFVHSGAVTAPLEVLYVRGVVRITDVTKFVPTFQQALAARLAADMAMAFTESVEREALCEQQYDRKVGRARSSDGRQGTSQRIRSDRLRRVRAGGLGHRR